MRSLSLLVPVLALVSMTALPVSAADLDPQAAPPPQADDPQMEFGNSWYLRGDIGGVLESQIPLANIAAPFGTIKRKAAVAADVGFGYKLNDWFRADILAEYRAPQTRNGLAGQILCPTASVLNPGGLSSTLVNSTCDVNGAAKMTHWNVMANAYVDLGNWGGLTPYLGAGVGLSHSVSRASTAASINPGGAAYGTRTITDAFSGVNTTYNFDRARASGGSTQFAWNVMAGAGYTVSDHTTIDLGYRYLNMGHFTGLADALGNVRKTKLTSHEVRLGVRYMID